MLIQNASPNLIHIQENLTVLAHTDHVPSVFPAPYGKQPKNRQEQRKERYDRLRKRYENYARRKNDEASPVQVGVTQEGDGPTKLAPKAKEAERETQEAAETLIRFSEAEIIKDEETQTEAVSTVDCAQQTRKFSWYVGGITKDKQEIAEENIWCWND